MEATNFEKNLWSEDGEWRIRKMKSYDLFSRTQIITVIKFKDQVVGICRVNRRKNIRYDIQKKSRSMREQRKTEEHMVGGCDLRIERNEKQDFEKKKAQNKME